jgi:hypothetical protein
MNNSYFVRHSKQEMYNFNQSIAEQEGWIVGDIIEESDWKGDYHEAIFGPFNKSLAKLTFQKIKNIKNLHYSMTQDEWKVHTSIKGKKSIMRSTGCNYHDLGYYYEYLSIENPLEQATNMSVNEWLKKMDMEECLETGIPEYPK